MQPALDIKGNADFLSGLADNTGFVRETKPVQIGSAGTEKAVLTVFPEKLTFGMMEKRLSEDMLQAGVRRRKEILFHTVRFKHLKDELLTVGQMVERIFRQIYQDILGR